jgi:hypothetical protein
MEFRVEGGGQTLVDHLENVPANAKYTSHITQNDLIDISDTIIRDKLVRDANASIDFSVLADETTDKSGTEQLSLGVRL